jgi:Tfp pilus assembly PilM family ATPase
MFNEAFIGLDLDRQAVKGVRVERRWNRVTVTQTDTLRLPPAGGDVAAIIGRWLDSLGWRDLPCVASVPGHATILKNLELAPGDPRTLRQAAALEVHRLAEMTGESFVHDVLELKPGPAGQARALLFVIRGHGLEAVLKPLNDIGLDVIEVTPAPVALFNMLTWTGLDKEAVTLGLVIGYGATEVVVGVRSGVRFVRSFEIGVRAFAEALAQARQIPPAQAEDSLFDGTVDLAALPGHSSLPVPLAEILHSWLGEVTMSLDLYRDRYPNAADAPRHLVLAGGGTRLSGLSDVLTRRTGLALQALQIPGPGSGTLADPHDYAVATGLALQGAGVDASSISMAPTPVRERRRWRKERWFWLGTLMVAAALAGVLALRQTRAQHHRQTVADAEQQSVERVARLRGQWAALRADNEERLGRLGDLYAVVRNRNVAVNVLAALQSAKAPSDWFTVISNSPSPSVAAPLPGPATNGAASAGLLHEFNVQGYTPDASFYSVRTMIRAIKKHDALKAVDLLDESSPSAATGEWSVLRCVPFTLRILAADDLQGLPDAITASGMSVPPGSEEQLRHALQAQTVLTTNLQTAWTTARQAFSTFKQHDDAFNVPVEVDAALIDFRVALVETQRKLAAEADRRKAPFPAEFGLSEAASADTDVRGLFYQLATIRILVEQALEHGISAIESLEPLPAVEPPAGGMTNRWVEYPVRMVALGRYPALEALIRNTGTPRQFLAIKTIRLERLTVEDPESIRATLEASALVFQETTNTAASAGTPGGLHAH